MKLGMVGLGRMGGNMRERLRRGGHEVIGYTRDPTRSDVASLAALVESLSSPRIAWLMIPAGAPTDEVAEQLSELLQAGDILIDGGNSRYTDSMRRGVELGEKGIGFVDAGVSGGVWGLENGYCLMVGGEDNHIKTLQPIFDSLAPAGGFVHAGPVGAGHFTKMVHNGVEYGMMQSFAEGYELLRASDLGIDVEGALSAWRNGSVVRSWLLDLLVSALEADPGLEKIKGWAEDSGEGRWTVDEAVRLEVPLHAISAALFARFASRQDESDAMKVIAALRGQFGGHSTKS